MLFHTRRHLWHLHCNLLTIIFRIAVLVDDAGGRFKKEVIVDGQSFLLLIRDEGGPPDMQVSEARHAVFTTVGLKVAVTLLCSKFFLHFDVIRNFC